MTSSGNSLAEIVCLVDDDPAVLKSIGRLLASDGLGVRPFSEAKSFLAYVEAHQVPLVVLDIWMEEMSGLEAQVHLRMISPETKIIIITGSQDQATRATAIREGAFAFFVKPFDDTQFLAAVNAALGQGRWL
jgi:FixJ family two-component response regulator